MCYVLYYEPREDEPQYICWLADKESAEDFKEIVEEKTGLSIEVMKMPMINARRLRLDYVDKVWPQYAPA